MAVAAGQHSHDDCHHGAAGRIGKGRWASLGVAAIAVAARFACTDGASRMGYLSPKTVVLVSHRQSTM